MEWYSELNFKETFNRKRKVHRYCCQYANHKSRSDYAGVVEVEQDEVVAAVEAVFVPTATTMLVHL